MEDCLFCKIWRGEVPTEELYRDEEILVIKDIRPKAPVHLLLIPRKHLRSLAEATESDKSLLGSLLLRAKKQAEALKIANDGYRIIINTRHHSGQEVDHLHVHLLGGEPLGPMMAD